MFEQTDSAVDSANLLRNLPVFNGFSVSEKLKLFSERLLSVVGADVVGKEYMQYRRPTMFKLGIDAGFEPFTPSRFKLAFQRLAQVLDSFIPTAEASTGEIPVLIKLGDGTYTRGMTRWKRDVDRQR